MVFVNAKKFACANCINGHRSSSCSHVNRPLYEIKKKGRPVSQCGRCRDLRKTRRIHVKCICDERPPQEPPVPWSPTTRKTAPRRIPSVPTLPNGLKDLPLLEIEEAKFDGSCAVIEARQGLYAFLNPPSLSRFSPPGSRSATGSPFSQTPSLPSPPSSTSFSLPLPASGYHSAVSPVPVHHRQLLPSVAELVGHADQSSIHHYSPSCNCSHCDAGNRQGHRLDVSYDIKPPRKISPTQALIEKSASMVPPPPSSMKRLGRGDLARLSCCRGRCGCPPGFCGCGDECHGCGGGPGETSTSFSWPLKKLSDCSNCLS